MIQETPEQKRITDALLQALKEIAALVSALDDQAFCYKGDGIIEGSVGEHVRHSLDHIAVLLDCIKEPGEKAGRRPSRIYYDRRERGTALERDRRLCLIRIQEQIEKIKAISIDKNLLAQEIEIEHVIDQEGSQKTFASNLRREFMFVYHHLIHHKATIAIRLRLLKRPVASNFDIAPATLAQN